MNKYLGEDRMASGEDVIIEYITKDNVDSYPFIIPEYRQMLLEGVIDNIKLERRKPTEVEMRDLLRKEEQRVRRRERRRRLRQWRAKVKRLQRVGIVEEEGTPRGLVREDTAEISSD